MTRPYSPSKLGVPGISQPGLLQEQNLASDFRPTGKSALTDQSNGTSEGVPLRTNGLDLEGDHASPADGVGGPSWWHKALQKMSTTAHKASPNARSPATAEDEPLSRSAGSLPRRGMRHGSRVDTGFMQRLPREGIVKRVRPRGSRTQRRKQKKPFFQAMPLKVNINDEPDEVKELYRLRGEAYAVQPFELKRRVESGVIHAALEPTDDKDLDTKEAIRCFWCAQKGEFFFILVDLIRAFNFFRGTPRYEKESKSLCANLIKRFNLCSIRMQAQEEGKDDDDYQAWIRWLSALEPCGQNISVYISMSWNSFVQALKEESNYS